MGFEHSQSIVDEADPNKCLAKIALPSHSLLEGKAGGVCIPVQQWGSGAAGEVAAPDKSPEEVDVMMKGSYKVDL